MTPAIVERHIEKAEAVAANLRSVADECTPSQEALRARWLQAAQTIDELVALLKAATFVAKLNHQTIKEMAR